MRDTLQPGETLDVAISAKVSPKEGGNWYGRAIESTRDRYVLGDLLYDNITTTQVFDVVDQEHKEKPLCVKVVRHSSPVPRDPEQDKNSEAYKMLQLKHNNLPVVLGYGAFNNYADQKFVSVLLMEKIEGEQFGRIVDGEYEGLKLDSVADLELAIKQFGDVMDYCHRMGVPHKDLSPGNLLWVRTPLRKLVLTDFGNVTRRSDGLYGTPEFNDPGITERDPYLGDKVAFLSTVLFLITGRVQKKQGATEYIGIPPAAFASQYLDIPFDEVTSEKAKRTVLTSGLTVQKVVEDIVKSNYNMTFTAMARMLCNAL